MRHSSTALRLIAVLVTTVATTAAQPGPKQPTLTYAAEANNFFGTFVISSLLHRDPRYFVTLHGGAGHRIGYALSRIVVARTDDGKDAANWAGMLGPLLAESLANSYLPVKEQTAGRTFQRYGIRIGLNTASNALKEYWPTIFRNLRITKIAPGSKSSPAATTPRAARPPLLQQRAGT